MTLIPASSARWMIRMLSSWSVFPHSPNIMAPRHNVLTDTPVRPRKRYSMPRSFLRARPPAACACRPTRWGGPSFQHVVIGVEALRPGPVGRDGPGRHREDPAVGVLEMGVLDGGMGPHHL